jgi:hypothetical protein
MERKLMSIIRAPGDASERDDAPEVLFSARTLLISCAAAGVAFLAAASAAVAAWVGARSAFGGVAGVAAGVAAGAPTFFLVWLKVASALHRLVG